MKTRSRSIYQLPLKQLREDVSASTGTGAAVGTGGYIATWAMAAEKRANELMWIKISWRKSTKWWHPHPNSWNKYEWMLFGFTFISKLNFLISGGVCQHNHLLTWGTFDVAVITQTETVWHVWGETWREPGKLFFWGGASHYSWNLFQSMAPSNFWHYERPESRLWLGPAMQIDRA